MMPPRAHFLPCPYLTNAVVDPNACVRNISVHCKLVAGSFSNAKVISSAMNLQERSQYILHAPKYSDLPYFIWQDPVTHPDSKSQ